MPRKKEPAKLYWIIYTIVFLLTFSLAYYVFFKYDKSFIYATDGKNQHYKAIIYYGRWLRTIFRNIFIEHKLQIPAYTFGLGYGSDILTTLHYYVIGDPLCFLSVFVPDKCMKLFYEICIVLRHYIAGITFSVLCFYRKKGTDAAVLTGSITYVFCTFTLEYANVHPYYMLPLIFMPIVILGIEKIIHENRSLVFVISVALSAISNFYFFYMIVVSAIIYAVIRVFFCCDDMKKRFVLWGKMLFGGIAGTLMSAPILFPILMQLSNDSRMGMSYRILPVYKLSYYKNLLSSLMITEDIGGWTTLGASFIIPLVLAYLFADRQRKYRQHRIFLGLLTIMVIIPYFGYVMHGFSYTCNRWVWVFPLFMSVTLVDCFDDFSENFRFSKFILAFMAIYIFIALILLKGRDNASKALISQAVILACVYVVMLIMAVTKNKHKDRIIEAAILIATCVSLFINGIYYFDTKNVYTRFIDDSEDIYNVATDTNAKKAAAINDGGFSRITSVAEENSAMMYGVSSTNFYFSLANPYINQFFREIGNSVISSFHINSLDGRLILNSLCGVKYDFSPEEEVFGATLADVEGTQVAVNEYALPVAYLYDRVLDDVSYRSYSTTMRQEALTQGIVVNDHDKEQELLNKYEQCSPEFLENSVPYEISCDENANLSDNRIEVLNPDARIKLTFSGRGDCETYFAVDGLKYEAFQQDGIWKYLEYNDPGRVNISISGIRGEEEVSGTSIKTATDTYQWNNGLTDHVANVGYHENGLTEIDLVLPEPGTYYFDDIKVVCQPLEEVASYLTDRNSLNITDYVLNDDNESHAISELSFKVNSDRAGIMVLNIPYSKGWEVFIDGVKSGLYRANTMFMATELEDGEHTIVLKYHTPGKTAGYFLLLIGICLTIFIGIREKKSEK